VISIQSYESWRKQGIDALIRLSISFALFRWSLLVVFVIRSTSESETVRQYTQLFVEVMLTPCRMWISNKYNKGLELDGS
jgi:hypothetical protein